MNHFAVIELVGLQAVVVAIEAIEAMEVIVAPTEVTDTMEVEVQVVGSPICGSTPIM